MNMKNGPPINGGFIPRDLTIHPAPHHPPYKSSVFRSPRMPAISLPSSPSEETGPVFGHDQLGPLDNDLVTNSAGSGQLALGPRIIVLGQVLDENGKGVPNTLLEVWQANAGGRYRHANEGYLAPLDPNFSGWGRCLTDEAGGYEFRSVRPGPYPWPNGANSWRPAHIHFSVLGPSFAQRLITQMYFEGDPLIARCPIVQAVSDASAIDRLTARLDLQQSLPMDAMAYRFDIVLRGRRQSIFENRPEGL